MRLGRELCAARALSFCLCLLGVFIGLLHLGASTRGEIGFPAGVRLRGA